MVFRTVRTLFLWRKQLVLYPPIRFRKCRNLSLNVTETMSNKKFVTTVLSAGILSFFKKEEETAEEKLTNTIKRAILCIQRDQYEKAEQMLHVALRIAQDLQHKNGITYVYDVMANLAMEREQFKKAEKLFVDVMKRLFADGETEESTKILHISSKIAHIAQLEGNLDKAYDGFKWTLEKIEKKMKSFEDDQELRELWGLTKNWLGMLLLEQGRFVEAKKCLQDAYNVFIEMHGKLNLEAVTLLNNLSVACTKVNDYVEARKFIEEALELVEELPELADAGVLKANLGLIYLQEGLVEQATEACAFAWRLAGKLKSERAKKQAEHCLNAINEMKNKK